MFGDIGMDDNDITNLPDVPSTDNSAASIKNTWAMRLEKFRCLAVVLRRRDLR